MSSSGDTGISGWINQNSSIIIDKIISEHPVIPFLIEEGYNVNKSTFTRCEYVSFLDDPTTISPEILRRTGNKISTDKLLAEIIHSYFPRMKINLKNKKDNKITTISAHFTAQSITIIDKIISSANFNNTLQKLEEASPINYKEISNTNAHLIRASICSSLNKLNHFKTNPHIYERASSLQHAEKTLTKIYDEKYKEVFKK